MENWRYNAVLISKYNPKFRNEEGSYSKNEWTDFGDIGKQYDGQLFTLNDYNLIEADYLEAAFVFFNYHNCSKITVVDKVILYEDDKVPSDNDEPKLFFYKFKNKRTINLHKIKNYIKLILRGYLSAELHCKNNDEVAVRFGYEFYMYFNSPKVQELKQEIENKTSLYWG